MLVMSGDELFSDLVVSGKGKRRPAFWLPLSLAGHALALAAVVLIPILWPATLPEHPNYIRALLYNPPPPPPPPLPQGSALVEKQQPAQPTTPDPKPDKPTFTAPIETPKEKPDQHDAKLAESEQAGSPTGSDFGTAEGMDIGVDGGVVGGVPGGVLGGVIGGTGDGPVLDYDQPPRLLKQIKPQYSPEAFIKKIEGEVELEILIGIDGRVRSVRVVRSIPLLDAAAIQCVYQWIFSPAIKHGHPVPTIASAPVRFRIY